MLLLAGCDWAQFRDGPEHTGFNVFETTIGPANVSGVRLRWSQSVGTQGITLPTTIANGVVYAACGGEALRVRRRHRKRALVIRRNRGSGLCRVGREWCRVRQHEERALCVGRGNRCETLVIERRRKRSDGRERCRVVSTDSGLYALDATTGAKRWSSTIGGSAPTVANGVVYVSTDERAVRVGRHNRSEALVQRAGHREQGAGSGKRCRVCRHRQRAPRVECHHGRRALGHARWIRRACGREWRGLRRRRSNSTRTTPRREQNSGLPIQRVSHRIPGGRERRGLHRRWSALRVQRGDGSATVVNRRRPVILSR